MNCTNSPNLYEESAEHLREEEAKRKANRRRLEHHNDNHGAVMRMEEHQSVSVSSQSARNFEVHDGQKFERKQSQPYEPQEQRKFDQQSSRGVKKYGQTGRFNQKETVLCGDRACGRNRQTSKVVEKTVNGGGLSKNDIYESKLEPNDSDEAQITQETASFYKNRVNNIPSTENKPNTVNPYPNHRQTYSDLKDPNNYSQYTSTTNSYTTKAINNGQPFIGASVSTTGYQSATTETSRGRFYAPTTYSPATYNSQRIKAASNQQFGARINSNLAKITTERSVEPPTTSTEKVNYFGYENKETTTSPPTTVTDSSRFTGRNTQTTSADYSTRQPYYSTADFNNPTSQTTTLSPRNYNNQFASFNQFSESFSTQYVPRGTTLYQETTTTDQSQTTTSAPSSNQYVSQHDQSQVTATVAPSTIQQNQYDATTTTFGPPDTPKNTAQSGYVNTESPTTSGTGETFVTSELFNVGSSYSSGSKIAVPNTPSPRLYIVSNNGGYVTSTIEPSTTTIESQSTTTVAPSGQDLSVAQNSYYSGRSGGRAFLNLLPPTTISEEKVQEPSTVATTVGAETSTLASGEAFTSSTTTAAPSERTTYNYDFVSTTLSSRSSGVESTTSERIELITDQPPRGFSASTTENSIETTSSITTELFNTGRTYGPNTTYVVSSSPRSPKLYVIPKGEEHRQFNFLEASTPKVVLGIIHDKDYKSTSGRFSGFYVTKSTSPNSEAIPYGSKISSTSKPLQPKPFSYESTTEFTTTTTTTETPSTTPTYYQISSASPFRHPESQSTPYESEEFNSVYENVDSMINVLKEIAKVNEKKPVDGSRPGLLIPPSASPETLHSLARYFANALDNLAAARGEVTTTGAPDANEEKKAVDDRNIELLLTHSTVDRYKELFNGKEEGGATTTTTTNPVQDSENDLDTETSNGPVQTTPRIRQLAQVFTKALSAYLDDPETFRKVLEEVRPTEPPNLETTTTTTTAAAATTTVAPSDDDEVLNFSDADVKVKPLPVFPTTLSPKPTWGYILANNINGTENLQEADSQSFVSQFNNLPTEKKAVVLPQTTLLPPVLDDVKQFNEALGSSKTQQNTPLPSDHWIDSPDATKLWQNNLFLNPSAVNDNLDGTTSESPSTTTEATVSSTIPVPTAEISYELRSLPQIRLNSTQVHGLLIDFMNKTEESDKLQRLLKKLNTTEEEFLNKMKQIESNPLTKRLVLLLISECGKNATQELETRVASVLDYTKQAKESLEPSSSNAAVYSATSDARENSNLKQLVHPSLDENEQDARALQLLNSLYTIASQWGK